jgi:hypothetical protein
VANFFSESPSFSSRFEPMSRGMRRLQMSERSVIGVLAVLSAGAGTLCLIFSMRPLPHSGKKVAKTVSRVISVLPDPVPSERYIPYVWKFGDWYSVTKSGSISVRAEPVREVAGSHFRLTWERTEGARIQISPDERFSGERRHLHAPAAVLDLTSFYIGENYWRVSPDGRRWSPSRHFTVEPEFLPDSVSVRAAYGEISVSASRAMKAFVVEYSDTAGFPPDRTVAFTRMGSSPKWQFREEGFLRARGVNSAGELTEYSTPVRLR